LPFWFWFLSVLDSLPFLTRGNLSASGFMPYYGSISHLNRFAGYAFGHTSALLQLNTGGVPCFSLVWIKKKSPAHDKQQFSRAVAVPAFALVAAFAGFWPGAGGWNETSRGKRTNQTCP